MRQPHLLEPGHDVGSFSCGVHALDEYLKRHALPNQAGGGARTYVATIGNGVVAYYSLAPASVEPSNVPARVAKGQSRAPIPVILIARLAVDAALQGDGWGEDMLLDALRRAERGSRIIGGRAVLVHAKDSKSRDFYLKHDFVPSPINELHLFMLMKDLRRALEIA